MLVHLVHRRLNHLGPARLESRLPRIESCSYACLCRRGVNVHETKCTTRRGTDKRARLTHALHELKPCLQVIGWRRTLWFCIPKYLQLKPLHRVHMRFHQSGLDPAQRSL